MKKPIVVKWALFDVKLYLIVVKRIISSDLLVFRR